MYTIKRTINSSDISYKNVIRLTNLINLVQDVEALHIDSMTKLKDEAYANNFSIPLNFRYLKILKWPKFKDEIKLVTYPYLTKSFFGYRNTLIYDKDNNLILESYSFGMFINLDTKTPHRISKETLDSINDLPKHKMSYHGRKVDIPENKKLINITKEKTKKTQIDYYNHLNNAFYLDMALNLLPDDFIYSEIFVEHMLAFKVNDLIIKELYEIDLGYLVILKNENNEIHAVIKFQ